MRALFLKEFTQARLLLLCGPLLGGLTVVLWLLLAGVALLPQLESETIDVFWGAVCYVMPPVIALFAGAGLFSGELERGTLPVLLALPLSRRHIWLAKVLAGLAIAASAAALLLLINAVFMPPEWQGVKFTLFLPDIVLWCGFAFAVALLCSTLCTHTISALLVSVLLCLALLAGAAYLVGGLGGNLLGYDPFLDLSLWMFAAVPALLAASFMGFSRGDLLQSWRKWAFALPALVIVLAAVCFPMIGLARWLTRYDRARVERLDDISYAQASPVIALTALSSPIAIQRDYERGWGAGEGSYRSRTLVLVDLNTGADILTRRGGGQAAFSPDGRLAAMLLDPVPITWGGRPSAVRPLEVWDLQQRRLLYRDHPGASYEGAGPASPTSDGRYLFGLTGAAEWSPDASWLTVRGRSSGDEVLLLMHPDGSEQRLVALLAGGLGSIFSYVGRSWDWSPESDALYTLDPNGRLMRHSLAAGGSQTVWDPGALHLASQRRTAASGVISVSPDGRSIAVALISLPDRYTRMELESGFRRARIEREAVLLVFVVSADGSGRLLIRQIPAPANLRDLSFTWSPDGRRLYFVDPRADSRTLLQWSEAAGEATPVPLNLRPGWPQLVPVPEMGGVMIWDVGRLWLANDGGEVIAFPNERVRATVADYYPMGLDNRGRLIVRTFWADEPQIIAAVDLHTGESTPIYP
ncbi:MAG: ABC transporter permease subunit [Armatimonadota bacterium]|nr:MAG: ABC transporter permease subunit [Armatimonadota bacterium]